MARYAYPGALVVTKNHISVSLCVTLYNTDGLVVSHMWSGFNFKTRGLWTLDAVYLMKLPNLKLFRVTNDR